MARIARNREAILRLRVDDEGGLLIDAAATPVLSVKDWDGVALAGAEVPSAVTRESQGVYRAELPGRTDLEILTANWSFQPSGGTFTRTSVEELLVVDRRVAPLWMFREDPELEDLSATNLLRLVDCVEDWFRSALGFPAAPEPFERSWRVSTLAAPTIGIPGIVFPESLTSWSVNDEVLDADQLAGLKVVGSHIAQTGGQDLSFLTGTRVSPSWGDGRYLVRGVHGGRPDWNGETPGDLQRAAVILARYASRNSTNYPERASQIAEENTLIFFSTPSYKKPTGLPEVDGVVSRYSLDSAI